MGALFRSPSRLIPSVVLLLVFGRLWFSVACQRMIRYWDKYTFDPVCVPRAGGKKGPNQWIVHSFQKCLKMLCELL